MADPATCLPLTPESISTTYDRIKTYIHKTPLITSRSLNHIASHPDPRSFLSGNPPPIWADASPASPPLTPSASTSTTPLPPPKLNLYLKLESHQKIGAFKARGAFSAITNLITTLSLPTLQHRGVITHSSGNHAQALALAASTFAIPAYIVMPSISTKSKIAGVRSFTHAGAGVHVVFSGSTAPEREAKVAEVIAARAEEPGGEGPVIVPPYDHPDIILGQGTTGLEMEAQFQGRQEGLARGCGGTAKIETEIESVTGTEGEIEIDTNADNLSPPRFDAVLTPLGGGGLLSGVATWFSDTNTHTSPSSASPPSRQNRTLIFGCEPHFQGANDGEIGLATGERVPHVSTLTIADGLRTPVGILPWRVISNTQLVEDVFSVSELEIKMALKLLMERVKVFVEPSSAVPVAVILFNKRFRELVAQRQRMEVEADGRDGGKVRVWEVGVVVSGGNMTVEGLGGLFGEGWLREGEDDEGSERDVEREVGKVGFDGTRVAEDVPG